MKPAEMELQASRCPRRALAGKFAAVTVLALLAACHEPSGAPSSTPSLQNTKGPSLVYVVHAAQLAARPQRYAQILAVDIQTQQQRILFSDKDQPFRLEAAGLAANKIFAYVGTRDPWATVKWENGKSSPVGYAMAELPLKVSGSYRRIFEPLGDNTIGQIFVHPKGEKIGYVATLGRLPVRDGYQPVRMMVFIHRTDTGQLLHRFELAAQPCHNCGVGSIGWYDDRRLHFSLTGPPDDYLGDQALADKLGIYTVNEDGSELVKLSAKLLFPPSKPSRQTGTLIPENIGVLPTGKLLVLAPPAVQGVPSSLYPVDLTQGAQHEYTVGTGHVFGFKLPYPGRHLVYQQRTPDKLVYLWLKDLETLAETRLLQLPEGDFQVLGWLSP